MNTCHHVTSCDVLTHEYIHHAHNMAKLDNFSKINMGLRLINSNDVKLLSCREGHSEYIADDVEVASDKRGHRCYSNLSATPRGFGSHHISPFPVIITHMKFVLISKFVYFFRVCFTSSCLDFSAVQTVDKGRSFY